MSNDIIAMAREVGLLGQGAKQDGIYIEALAHFADLAQAAERNKLASWMMAQGYATGHGETVEGLLEELEREVGFKRAELWLKRINEAVLAEREACADIAENWNCNGSPRLGVAAQIRARGKHVPEN
jgi:hypothetical protein